MPRMRVNRALERFLAESPKSWRETTITDDTSARVALVKERPWLSHYDDGVPHTIGIPRSPLHHFLRSAARRFPTPYTRCTCWGWRRSRY